MIHFNIVDTANRQVVEGSQRFLFHKESIVPKMLSLIPHRNVMGDLILVLGNWMMAESEKDSEKVLYSTKALESAGLTEDEVFEEAKKNEGELELVPLFEMAIKVAEAKGNIREAEQMREEYESLKMMGYADDAGFYLAAENIHYSNSTAGIICDRFSEIEKQIGPYVVIPASIKEVLILPIKERFSIEQIDSMIQAVNETACAPGEVLSDHAYIYENGRLFTSLQEYGQESA